MRRDFTDTRYDRLAHVNEQVLSNQMWNDFASWYSKLSPSTRELAADLGYSSLMSTLNSYTDFSREETAKCNKAMKNTFTAENEIDHRYAIMLKQTLGALESANAVVRQMAVGITPGGITVSTSVKRSVEQLVQDIDSTSDDLVHSVPESALADTLDELMRDFDYSGEALSAESAVSEEGWSIGKAVADTAANLTLNTIRSVASMVLTSADANPKLEKTYEFGDMTVKYKMELDGSLGGDDLAVIKLYKQMKQFSSDNLNLKLGPLTLSKSEAKLKVYEFKDTEHGLTGVVTIEGTGTSAVIRYTITKEEKTEQGLKATAKISIVVEGESGPKPFGKLVPVPVESPNTVKGYNYSILNSESAIYVPGSGWVRKSKLNRRLSPEASLELIRSLTPEQWKELGKWMLVGAGSAVVIVAGAVVVVYFAPGAAAALASGTASLSMLLESGQLVTQVAYY